MTMIAKKLLFLPCAVLLLASCGGGSPETKQDEEGHNPHPSQVISGESGAAEEEIAPVAVAEGTTDIVSGDTMAVSGQN